MTWLRRRRPHTSPARRPPYRPCLEALEERMALAGLTLTVINTGDTGTGAGLFGDLRYCVNQANNASAQGQSALVIFDPTLGSATVALVNGPLKLGGAGSSGLGMRETIDGQGRITVSGG